MAGNNPKKRRDAFTNAVEAHPMRNDIITYLNKVGVATQEKIVAELQATHDNLPAGEGKHTIDPTIVENQLTILSRNAAGIQALQEKTTRRLKANLDFLNSDDMAIALGTLRTQANEEKYVHMLYDIVKRLETGKIYLSHRGANDIPTSEKNIIAALHKIKKVNMPQPVANTKLNKMMGQGYLTNPHTRIDHKKGKRESKRKTHQEPIPMSQEAAKALHVLNVLKKGRAKDILILLNTAGPQTPTYVEEQNKYEQPVASQHLKALKKAGLLSMKKNPANRKFHHYRVNVETIKFIDKMINKITGANKTHGTDDFDRIKEDQD